MGPQLSFFEQEWKNEPLSAVNIQKTGEVPAGLVTLKEAREYVKEGSKIGVHCPCCQQFAKIYKRKLNSGMARVLIHLYIEYFKTAKEWVQVKEFLRQKKYRNNHDWTLLRFWGLLEPKEKEETDPEEMKCNGLWRVTVKGKQFVTDTRVRVSKRIIIYNNFFKGFDIEVINIKNALGNKFDYDELMNDTIINR